MEALLEIVSPLSLLLHLINLIILYIVFKIFLYKPLAQFMQKRTQKIQDERDWLDAERERLRLISDGSDKEIEQARTAAEDQIALIMKQSDRDGKNIIDDAEKEARLILEKARLDAEEEKRRSLDLMHEQVMELSIMLSSRILAREVSAIDHEKLMEEFLSEVK